MTIVQSKSSKSFTALWHKIHCFAVGSLRTKCTQVQGFSGQISHISITFIDYPSHEVMICWEATAWFFCRPDYAITPRLRDLARPVGKNA